MTSTLIHQQIYEGYAHVSNFHNELLLAVFRSETTESRFKFRTSFQTSVTLTRKHLYVVVSKCLFLIQPLLFRNCVIKQSCSLEMEYLRHRYNFVI
jgi:hypothetical protein